MSKDSLELFAQLLGQVQIRPLDQGANETWRRVTMAWDEIEQDLKSFDAPTA